MTDLVSLNQSLTAKEQKGRVEIHKNDPDGLDRFYNSTFDEIYALATHLVEVHKMRIASGKDPTPAINWNPYLDCYDDWAIPSYLEADGMQKIMH
jgi:hypothetical protein